MAQCSEAVPDIFNLEYSNRSNRTPSCTLRMSLRDLAHEKILEVSKGEATSPSSDKSKQQANGRIAFKLLGYNSSLGAATCVVE